MWQMQIFWGFTPDHECINNGTDYVLQPCGTENGTSCDYVMHSSYVSDFGLFCNDAKYLKFMQSAMLFGSFFGELLLGSLQETAPTFEVQEINVWFQTWCPRNPTNQNTIRKKFYWGCSESKLKLKFQKQIPILVAGPSTLENKTFQKAFFHWIRNEFWLSKIFKQWFKSYESCFIFETIIILIFQFSTHIT